MNMLGFYRKWVFEKPIPVLVLVLVICGVFASYLPRFRLDASADSLLLDNDPDLRFYQKAKRMFSSKVADEADEYLLLTYEPEDDLFSRERLAKLRALADELGKIEGISSVRSILDMPLFQSPKLSMFQIAASVATGLPTLERPTTDLELARKEIIESPYSGGLIISKDGKLTALIVIFEKDAEYTQLQRRREDLKSKKYETGLSPEESQELDAVQEKYLAKKEAADALQARRVAAVREVMSHHRDDVRLFLGGVPMIVADMIHYVQADLVVFGIGVLAFLVITLGLLFRRVRWVVLPLMTCILAVVFMLGLLGMAEWPATVISSNFTSLLFIITMSMVIHIIGRYRELHALQPDIDKIDLVFKATRLVALPCFYCTLTTMVGFGSLIVSGIQPVIDFGKMMFLGIGVSYIICFTFFPAALSLLAKPSRVANSSDDAPFSMRFATLTEKHGNWVMIGCLIVLVVGGFGISRLTVENRFIDYFKTSTDIYKGMVVADSRLGGTTPLEIVLTGEGKDYWMKPENLARLREVHEFLQAQSEVGKVISLDTVVRVGEGINNGQPLNPFLLGMVRNMLPDKMKNLLLRPFVNEEFSSVRLVALVRETDPNLERNKFLGKIRNFLYTDKGFTQENCRITGLYLLYNNLLQSLYYSQILTIGFVYAAVWLMFLVLFRGPYLATIALAPNVFPVVLVLGSLGLLGIPLDIMTITISAITIGIAVDQTIHYVHRFKEEFPRLGNYNATMHACHKSIGRAMYYTSITIIAGFSILTLSSFKPTIYFGLFTSMAMIAALLGSLTLLPYLLVWLKPLGPEHEPAKVAAEGAA